jgi:hypothetical protein
VGRGGCQVLAELFRKQARYVAIEVLTRLERGLSSSVPLAFAGSCVDSFMVSIFASEPFSACLILESGICEWAPVRDAHDTGMRISLEVSGTGLFIEKRRLEVIARQVDGKHRL